MFRINRLRIVVNTEKKRFGFDKRFNKKLNFIASYENTKGKSSCIEAIYYALGLEELIGGTNGKALKPVFKAKLQYENKEYAVLESEFYLEIENSLKKINTIYRPGKKKTEKENLVKVYYGSIEQLMEGSIDYDYMYVHLKGSASNYKGFHRYLEKFIGIDLPYVPSYDNMDRKLYLQIIFSTIFTEQKRGWSDLFACMPTYLKIRDSKKRTVEYLIGLKSLLNEKNRQLCKDNETEIKKEWQIIYNKINFILSSKECYLSNLNPNPEIIDNQKVVSIYKCEKNEERLHIDDYIEKLKNKLKNLNTSSIIVGDNIDDIQEKFRIKQNELISMEKLLLKEKENLLEIDYNIGILKQNIRSVNLDLENNKDVKKLKKLGANFNLSIANDICPICNQKIHDILLPQNQELKVMSIDENINHLEAQKSMLEFTIKNYEKNKLICNGNIERINNNINEYRKILRSIKNDLYSIDSSISESVVRQKINTENEICDLENMKKEISFLYDKLLHLSEKWKENLEKINNLPKSNLDSDDKQKIKYLKDKFVENINLYGYKSISDLTKIEISEDKLIPIVDGFDMKFDSSASDNIRAIWAFNVALMQTSLEYTGNHPNLLIFDEPGQQSMIVSDLCKFIKMLSKIEEEIQVIIGITIDDEIEKNIKSVDDSRYNLILVDNKSIYPLE